MGRLPDTRYAALDAQYAKGQDELSGEIDGLEKAISGFGQSKKSALRAEDMAKGVFYIAGSIPQQEPQKGTLPPRAVI